MSAQQLVAQARRVPAAVWVLAAAGGLFYLTRPRPSSALDAGTPLGSEDVQVMSAAGAYNPVGAHAMGLPYELGHCCPVTWEGRTKHYPSRAGGVLGMLAAPDPADDDGYPWLSYGPQRGGPI